MKPELTYEQASYLLDYVKHGGQIIDVIPTRHPHGEKEKKGAKTIKRFLNWAIEKELEKIVEA